jgi:hypothetical protein
LFRTKAVLGEQNYEPFGRTGESMTDPEYAYDQIEPAREDLEPCLEIDHV